jgi:hypothetical protein
MRTLRGSLRNPERQRIFDNSTHEVLLPMIIQINYLNGYPSSHLYREIKDAIWLVLELLSKIQQQEQQEKKREHQNAALLTLLETSRFAERNEAYLKYLQDWLVREYPQRIAIKILSWQDVKNLLEILKEEENQTNQKEESK